MRSHLMSAAFHHSYRIVLLYLVYAIADANEVMRAEFWWWLGFLFTHLMWFSEMAHEKR